MRQVKNKQFQLGETPISQIKINPQSRDDIPQILRGLQYIYVNAELREQVFNILETMVPQGVSPENGRPGMELWKILVLGTLRLDLNWDYDRLQEMANHHRTIRQMLGHGMADDKYTYKLQTLKDNVCWLTPEILDKINQVVVKAGHNLVRKKDEPLRGKCDSFVVQTDVHYPTDINLLFDAMRKVVALVAQLCAVHGLTEWRQSAYTIRLIKRLFRQAQQVKRSTSNNPKKKKKQARRIVKAHQEYIGTAGSYLQKVEHTLETLGGRGVREGELVEIKRFMAHAERQIDQIKRRVLNGEKIPHEEKVFSVFEEHTEWICKGKAGVPVELGLRVCVMEDQYGFILHHKVMQKQTDDQVAVPMVAETQKRFPQLKACSFDKGFHSPANRDELRKLLNFLVLPRKGRLGQKDKEIEYSGEFIQAKRRHSAVESGINALEVHGLDRCPDQGLEGFERYVALAILARNTQKLGTLIQKKEFHRKRLKIRKKAA